MVSTLSVAVIVAEYVPAAEGVPWKIPVLLIVKPADIAFPVAE